MYVKRNALADPTFDSTFAALRGHTCTALMALAENNQRQPTGQRVRHRSCALARVDGAHDPPT